MAKERSKPYKNLLMDNIIFAETELESYSKSCNSGLKYP